MIKRKNLLFPGNRTSIWLRRYFNDHSLMIWLKAILLQLDSLILCYLVGYTVVLMLLLVCQF